MSSCLCRLLMILSWLVTPHALALAGESAPVLSHQAGFYDKPFFLQITHPDPAAAIYYTLDGSDPDPAHVDGVTYRYKNTYSYRRGDPFGEFLEARFHSHRYEHALVVADRSPLPDRYTRISTALGHTEPHYFPEIGQLSKGNRRRNALIDPVNSVVNGLNRTLALWGITSLGPIPTLTRHEPPGSNRLLKATALRAAAFKDGQQIGPVVSATYFVMPRETFSLPVVSLMAQDDRLFGYESGILVAGKAHDDFRKEQPDQQRAQGAAPANWRLRGLEVPTHLQYFSDRIDPQRASLDQGVGIRVHGGATRYAPIKSLRLYARKSYGATHMEHPFFGEPQKYKRLLLRNSGNDFRASLFRDAITHVASANLAFDTQAYQPTVVFLNGEYWGILNLRERHDAHYLERVYGVDEEDLDLMDLNEASVGDDLNWRALLTFLQSHSLRDPRNYAHVQSQVDIENFIDYQVTNLYAGNSDWPQNNQRFWRKRTTGETGDDRPGHDGRWRWLLFDVDMGMTYPQRSRLKAATTMDRGGPERNIPKTLFARLIDNPDFRERFLTRYADLLNTSFTTERMQDIIMRLHHGIAPEIDRHILRWQLPESRETWESVTEHFMRFAQERPDLERKQLVDFFRLGGLYTLEVDVAGSPQGHVRVNSTVIAPGTDGVSDRPYPWRGVYFKGLPLSVEPHPKACFSHWEALDAPGPELRLSPSEDLRLRAVFRDGCTTD